MHRSESGEQAADSIATGRKRRKPAPAAASTPQPRRPFHRAKKKQKRLDAIRDHVAEPIQSPPDAPRPSEPEPGSLRRSTRVRRPPVALNSSPSPKRKKKRRFKTTPNKTNKNGDVSDDTKKRGPYPVRSVGDDFKESGNWETRLRSRARNVTPSPTNEKGKRKLFQESDGGKEEQKMVKPKRICEVKDSVNLEKILLLDDEEEVNVITVNSHISDSSNEVPSATNEPELNSDNEAPSLTKEDMPCSVKEVSPQLTSKIQQVQDMNHTLIPECEPDVSSPHIFEEQRTEKGNEQLEQPNCEPENETDNIIVGGNLEDTDAVKESSKDLHKVDALTPVSEDANVVRSRIREGRRCGLCGGGTDGKPPRKLVRDFGDSDNEAYGGLSASEEPNYDMWDGFDNEPGWLGPLLGPIHDRFGIAGVWVHQHCAVWSPEVYFAGLGCLKNVRAALCRGRALKCSRCGRPGATIGCRVDRCPKTYHLPCARAEGSIFDHRKFLIACADHRHLFQPHGSEYLQRIKKLKARKMKFEMRKLSNEASRKDFETEERWLENCGEDDEFLRREGRRLHRDLQRISPTYIGGESYSQNEKLYPGFESVAGLQDVIQCMKEVVILPLLYPEFFSRLGITPPRGVLLHGYPGTGKTLVVKALIGACSRGDKRIAYFARKGADCLGKYVGDAERQLRLLFQVAEKSQPSIIFFDEIDGLAPRRSKQQDQTHSSVVSTLLALLDGLKPRGSVVVIGATNRPEAVDPALRRPGRFDREIYFPLPSLKDRSAILSLHTQGWPKPVSGSLLNWIAEQTVGYAGADLQALCTQAAMVALKRNCALQELLSSAEKYPYHRRRLSLPPFTVEEQDWLAALAHAPPPCSRREVGASANDIVSSPLHPHLVPCLLPPIAHLLISLYLDERIWLPLSLSKAAKLLKDVTFSALEQKKLPSLSWGSYLCELMQEPAIANEAERILVVTGFLTGMPSFSAPEALENGHNDDCENPNPVICKFNPKGFHLGRNPVRKGAASLETKSGFRMLVSGNRRCGQRYLAACLLHGFVGHVEVHKANLATISQEGRGDIIQGLTRILLKCSSVGRCVIYMPRIDLWAIEDSYSQTAGKVVRMCTEAWSSFVEQVDSMSNSSSLIIMATYETSDLSLPHRIKQFFSHNVPNGTIPSYCEHTIPRFFMHLDGIFNHELVFDLSAEKLSWDLIKQYIQLIHHKTHMAEAQDEIKICHDKNSDVEFHDMSTKAFIEDAESKKCFSLTKLDSKEANIDIQPRQASLVRSPSLRTKGKSSLLSSIAAFGYQILRYPHFAELCWATSKLKEGPCTGINGPWKGWPFNSCFIRPNDSVEKPASGGKTSENSVVRGLIAVGLLAYRGVYSSVMEVSLEVRRVLELLVEQVNSKILGGKDSYRFLRLLSQVAYFEDVVNSWAYSLYSLDIENPASTSNPRPSTEGRLGEHACTTALVENGEREPSFSVRNPEEVRLKVVEDNPNGFLTENNGRISPEKVVLIDMQDNDRGILGLQVDKSGLAVDENPNKELTPPRVLIPKVGGLENGVAMFQGRVPFSPVCTPHDSACDSSSFASENPYRPEAIVPNGGITHEVLDSSKPSKSSMMDYECSDGYVSSRIFQSKEDGLNSSEPVGMVNTVVQEHKKNSSTPETSCLYSCCSGCVHRIQVLLREIIISSLKSNQVGLTIEDVHDVVETCSVTLLATIRKSFLSERRIEVNECGMVCCRVCGCKNVGHMHHEEISQSMETKPKECNCHREGNHTFFGRTRMKFFFRNCTMVPLDPGQATFHCNVEKLCICSAIGKISTIKQPLD
ncbi:hypothetical protein H6P81_013903 [Aristolochia fimbriata]|uniref:PHD-type domain-containing protein n=1 Tax=Aristolochia fimbriata TaxID=158543 RepID=A0AAV7EI60_ARIFI|nr:hypothetical protein H6P81_013903 [Aristolochia fimbriata]